MTASAIVHGLVSADGLVARIDAPAAALASAAEGLPQGEALLEAVAARLGRSGWRLEWGEPEAEPDRTALRMRLHAWGRSSVEVWRADPGLLSALHLGDWLTGSLVLRARRRLGAAADVAFWRGARAEATREEWRRLTRGYAALLYHRLAGAGQPGQERVDVPPRVFRRHLRALRLVRFVPLTDEDVAAFHRRDSGVAPRAVLLTVDDGFRDCVLPLAEAARAQPLLFVPTGAVGTKAGWLDCVEVASWDELQSLADAGVRIGSHGRTHVRLTMLDDEALCAEVVGSKAELEERLGAPPPVFSYPYGAVDDRVRAAVAEHGYVLAYTTRPGLNGAGTDPYLLRRVSVKAWDSGPAVVWKALTGEPLPPVWERWLLRRRALRRRLLPWVRRDRAGVPRSSEPPQQPGT